MAVASLSGAGCVDNLVRSLKVGVVEDVEELGAELKPSPLAQLGGLKQRKIPVGVAGAGESIATEVADRAVDGRGVCGWVE